MKIVLAPDSFKECMTAAEACTAMARGIRARLPDAEIVAAPMADGGEGTLEVLAAVIPGEAVTREVSGPLGAPVPAAYWFAQDRQLAVIEAARAIGLGLVVPAARDPMRATSRGLGELLAAALDRGARRLLVTLGGSATVDGGAGMARALGYTLLDANGAPLPEGGAALEQLARIVAPGERPWCAAEIEVACDVTNPLLGPRGAAPVFGPQKGATAEMVAQLDRGLAQLAARFSADLGVDPAPAVGAGAAGGLGAGLAAFTGARLRRGVDLVIEQIGLAQTLRGADLVLTGEGRVDRQSAEGKVCAGVGRLARSLGIPCIVLAGAVEEPLDALYELGVTATRCIAREPRPLADALTHAADDLAAAAGEVAHHWSNR